MSVVDRFRKHAVLLDVMRQHGVDIDNLPWEDCDEAVGQQIRRLPTGNLPSLYLHSNGRVAIRWFNNGQQVRYDIEEDGYCIVTIVEMETPATMLTALSGRTLDVIVEMPGADTMLIIEAVNSRAFVSDPMDTRIAVEPIGDNKMANAA